MRKHCFPTNCNDVGRSTLVAKQGVLIVLLTMLVGCGGSSSDDIRVKGRVNFQGAPVPVGRIDFIPTAGAAGSGGYAMIKDGAFDTREDGKTLAAGKYLACINGFKGDAPKDAESSNGTVPFQGYEQEIDVAPGQDDVLFEVPKK